MFKRNVLRKNVRFAVDGKPDNFCRSIEYRTRNGKKLFGYIAGRFVVRSAISFKFLEIFICERFVCRNSFVLDFRFVFGGVIFFLRFDFGAYIERFVFIPRAIDANISIERVQALGRRGFLNVFRGFVFWKRIVRRRRDDDIIPDIFSSSS